MTWRNLKGIVVFGGEKENGLYRYLLTKLDGLESASSGRMGVPQNRGLPITAVVLHNRIVTAIQPAHHTFRSASHLPQP